MRTDTELVFDCMEAVAEKNVDISSSVYAIFFANTPDANQPMAHMDTLMKGRMLDQVYALLLGDIDEGYIQFEARTHSGYGATPALYRGLLSAVKDSVREVMAGNWRAEHEAAWGRSIEKIVGAFEQAVKMP